MAKEHWEGGIAGSWERKGGDGDLHEAGRSLRDARGLRGEPEKGAGDRAPGGGAGGRSRPIRRRSPEPVAAGERLPRLFARAPRFASASAAAAACSSSSVAAAAAARSPAAPSAMAAAGTRRGPGPGPSSRLRERLRRGFHPAPPPLLLFLCLLSPRPLLAGATAAASQEPDSPCRLKTVTVSTLPALRESDIGWSGARTGAGTGTGAGAAAAAAASPGSAGSAGTAAETRLLLFVRNELPGRIAVQDDLDNTELPFFTLGKAGRRHPRIPGHRRR